MKVLHPNNGGGEDSKHGGTNVGDQSTNNQSDSNFERSELESQNMAKLVRVATL